MPCYHPLQAKYYFDNEFGKRVISFKYSKNYNYALQRGFDRSLIDPDIIRLPCGRCIGCRLERSRQWATRIVHEADCHRSNLFLTLTYADSHIVNCADGPTLTKTHYRDFMKRLRIGLERGTHPALRSDCGVRYYQCGEYGDLFARPHHHACVFDLYVDDKRLYKAGKNKLWISDTLTDIWGHGYVIIGDLVFESAAYVARYCTKKITGREADDHYGERLPEYSTMSLKPGIGAKWFEKNFSDCYPSDYLIIRGAKCKIPRYYDKLLEQRDPVLLEALKQKRREHALGDRTEDQTYDRLAVREQVVSDKFLKKIRSYETIYNNLVF